MQDQGAHLDEEEEEEEAVEEEEEEEDDGEAAEEEDMDADEWSESDEMYQPRDAAAEDDADTQPPLPDAAVFAEMLAARADGEWLPSAALKVERFVDFIVRHARVDSGLSIQRQDWFCAEKVECGVQDEIMELRVTSALMGSLRPQQRLKFSPPTVHRLATAIFQLALFCTPSSPVYEGGCPETIYEAFCEAACEVQDAHNEIVGSDDEEEEEEEEDEVED